jgi:hypothetical protein
LKFVGHLAQFSDLEEGFVTSFHSKMNDNSIIPDNAKGNPHEVFGEDDVPF